MSDVITINLPPHLYVRNTGFIFNHPGNHKLDVTLKPDVLEWLNERDAKYGEDWIVSLVSHLDVARDRMHRQATITFADDNLAMEFRLTWA
jgi:hypothetical protein